MQFKVKRSAKDSNETLVNLPTFFSDPRIGQEISATAKTQDAEHVLTVTLVGDGMSYLVGQTVVRILPKTRKGKGGSLRVWQNGKGNTTWIQPVRPVEPKVSAAQLGGGPLKSPMSGKILKVLVKRGDLVKEGQLLCVIEAMKMENQIKSECDGSVENVKVQEGASVTSGEVLLSLLAKS